MAFIANGLFSVNVIIKAFNLFFKRSKIALYSVFAKMLYEAILSQIGLKPMHGYYEPP